MSVSLYDQAVVNKIKSWCGDTRLRVISSSDTENFLSTAADEANDQQIELPIIQVSRDGFQLLQTERATITSYGLTIETNPNKSEWINAIQIGLTYQIDIFTRYMSEANEYLRNIIFNIINFPRITIELPYYDQYLPFNSSLHLQSEVQDNSAVPQRLIYGQFTRMTLTVEVKDAYLFDTRINNNIKIKSDIYLDDEILQKEIVINNGD